MWCLFFLLLSDSLASDLDSYLKQKLAETERELDTAERKVKDLQLRLKRFAKDDQIKDEKIFQMEKEVKELSEHIKKLERSVEDSKTENNNNATLQANPDKNDSKVCIILWYWKLFLYSFLFIFWIVMVDYNVGCWIFKCAQMNFFYWQRHFNTIFIWLVYSVIINILTCYFHHLFEVCYKHYTLIYVEEKEEI